MKISLVKYTVLIRETPMHWTFGDFMDEKRDTFYMLQLVKRGAELTTQWIPYAYRNTREDGVKGFYRSVMTGCEYGTIGVTRNFAKGVYNPGTPVWKRDWDVLLILDACRLDLMKEVASEYSFIDRPENVDSVWSVASMSDDWMERTFSEAYREDVENTAYISGNAFTAKVDFPVEPALVDEVWKREWNNEVNTILARPLTNRAISTWREGNFDRMIVHYMQPHVPFVNRPDLGEYTNPERFGEGFADIWGRIGSELDEDGVWAAYQDNLRHVLDDVELLLDNADADTVAISADHGNAVGEFGITGHPSDVLLPSIRRVPWIETSATDSGEYDPEYESADESDGDSDVDVTERLKHLGYHE